MNPRKPSFLVRIAEGILAAIIAGVSYFTLYEILVPIGLALLAAWLFMKSVPLRNKPVVPAAAVQAGHALTVLLGFLILLKFDFSLTEPILYVVGAIVLAYRPSLKVVGVLLCYQLLGLVINGLTLVDGEESIFRFKIFLIHIIFRLAAISLMIQGLIEIHRQGTTEALATEVSATEHG